jgi:NitT/TauT family transport system permease protein
MTTRSWAASLVCHPPEDIVALHFSKISITRALLIIGAFAALEVLCRIGVIDRITMIPPTEMAGSLWSILASGRFNEDIAFTIWNTAVAVTFSVVGGFFAGALLHAFPRARRAIEPLLSAYYAVPIFVFYPLLVVAFGVGRASLIAMGALFGIVAMIVNTMLGLDRVPSVIVKTAATMKLGRWTSLLRVRLPAASPHLVTGVKLAVAYTVIAIVAGEFILATAGMGKRIAFGYNDFDNPTMYGMLLLLLALVMIVNGALSAWERRLHRRFGQQ